MQQPHSQNIFWRIGLGLVWIWAFTAVLRMAFRMPEAAGLALLLALMACLFIFMGWGVSRKLTKGEFPTKEEERAAIRGIGASWLNVIVIGFYGGVLGCLIAVVELNNSLSYEAVECAAAAQPLLFWPILAVGVLLGAGSQIWATRFGPKALNGGAKVEGAASAPSEHVGRSNG